MIKVYFTNSLKLSEQQSIDDLLQQLPSSMHERAVRYRFDKDRYNFILGRHLLLSAIQDLKFDESLITELHFNDFQKPLLEELSFSISHSGHWVVCAASAKCQLGVDIEVPNSIKDISNLKSYFTKVEWKDITESIDTKHRLYQYWTAKESVLKAEGSGVTRLMDLELVPFKKCRFKREEKWWYLQQLDLDSELICTLCSDVEEMGIEVVEVEHF